GDSRRCKVDAGPDGDQTASTSPSAPTQLRPMRPATGGLQRVEAVSETATGANQPERQTFPGFGAPPPPPATGVQILDVTGNPSAELDRVTANVITEQKSAQGLYTIPPGRTVPQQTPDEWAEKQIF